jgi:hypothetical protein
MSIETDIALLRDLIDRRPDLNAVALRPGQAVHVHALERVLATVERVQADDSTTAEELDRWGL